MKDNKEFVEFLKSKGYTTPEIMYALSLRNVGVAMTKAIYKFNELYDSGNIDGFPDSSLEVLEMFYGKKLKKMSEKTLIKKVETLQRCLESNIDYEHITESVKYYLS